MKVPSVIKGMAIATAIGASMAVQAAVLTMGNPGQVIGTSGPVPPAVPAYGPLVSTVTVPGWFEARVTSVAHPNGIGGVTFWYKLENLATPPNGQPLYGFSVNWGNGLTAPTLDVGQTVGGVDAFTALYAGSGISVGWQWAGNVIDDGDSSGWLSMATPWSQVGTGQAGIIDGAVGSGPVLVPVPEPTTYAGLFALGLAGFAAYRRFRA